MAFADPEFDAQFLRALDAIFAGGADIGECYMTARRITPGDEDSWLKEWNATGDMVDAAAEASLAVGHQVSARESFLRAATYYRTSGVFLYRPPLDPRFVDSCKRQRDAFQRAAKLSEWTIETVEIPYEQTTLEGYFATPAGKGPFKTLVIVVGSGPHACPVANRNVRDENAGDRPAADGQPLGVPRRWPDAPPRVQCSGKRHQRAELRAR